MQKIEIARSFSYKLNLGNYSNADFFCSQKAEVEPDELEIASKILYEFCRNEVMKSVEEYKESLKPKPKISQKEAVMPSFRDVKVHPEITREYAKVGKK